MEKNTILEEEICFNNLVEISSENLEKTVVDNSKVNESLSHNFEEVDDETQLENFLQSIDMPNIFNYLKDANVTYRSLRYLTEQNLKEAVPPLGFRAEFREKLSIWKKKFCIQKDLSEPEIGHCRTPSKKSFGTSVLKDLNTLLNETSRGKSILAFEHQHKHLTDSHRDDIISIIIEEVINNNLVLHSQDFLVLFNDICSVFPCENEMQDYYYIPRKGKTMRVENCIQNTRINT
ncbi:uncharacterized protein LOC142227941 [Haematobia irritans]|uniref:uncharacterized protein LOC142227941 n=1 Tax=Haematobia irritans TaxID=7368 RepID=UPI003F502E9D